jgi:hypothetical protein
MEATAPVTITLAARDWNVIIMALHEMPKRVADPLIAAIAAQARAAEGAVTAEAAPILAPERANGQAPAEGAASA